MEGGTTSPGGVDERVAALDERVAALEAENRRLRGQAETADRLRRERDGLRTTADRLRRERDGARGVAAIATAETASTKP